MTDMLQAGSTGGANGSRHEGVFKPNALGSQPIYIRRLEKRVQDTQHVEALIVGRQAYDQYDVDSIALPENLKDPMTDKPAMYRRDQQIWKDFTDDQWRGYMSRIPASCRVVVWSRH